MKKNKTMLSAVAVAGFSCALALGAGAAAAEPSSPVFPDTVTKECKAPGVSKGVECTATMLTVRQTNDLRNTGIPDMLGEWFNAGPAFDSAKKKDTQDCVTFGLWDDGAVIGFNYVRSDSINWKCVP